MAVGHCKSALSGAFATLSIQIVLKATMRACAKSCCSKLRVRCMFRFITIFLCAGLVCLFVICLLSNVFVACLLRAASCLNDRLTDVINKLIAVSL